MKSGPKLGLMMVGKPYRQMIAVAGAAEDAGFGSLWSGDSGDVFGTLNGYAMTTDRITVGAGVAVWTRPPIIAANAAANLANLSNGRFVLGLGPGPKQWNEDWWGISFTKPIGRMREYIEVIRAALNLKKGETLNYPGKHFQIRGFSRFGQVESPPPIFLGTVGVQMNRLAGSHCDGALFDVCLPPRYLRDVAIPAVAEGLQRSGRDWSRFTRAVMMACVVDDDIRAARRAVKHGMLVHLTTDYLPPIWAADGFGPETQLARERYLAGDVTGAVEALSDDFAAYLSISGTADECRAKIRELLGFLDHIVLWCPNAPGADQVSIDRTIETFANFSG